ncbi:branched chain amino acid ABC transporter inner membrane protein [Caballeronia temeraria]|uniref:Branched chain amino acid ABC transporter inner membrane protein n=1 Tax=Caballeronia temeraria TaxID=1777137 RepID=A0A158DJ55_9BURK|nr:branched-chain amino acid ABC transporter permease [Caballeronia temeraria]SAK94493.1 branched chain amino acid ABC transporter inner membrane protein [Caballeronia temeraria]
MRKFHLSSWLAGTVLAVGASAFATNAYAISIINLAAIAALTAASMRFVMLIGEVSFATAAFVGMGAYGAGVATTIFDWPFPVAMLLGPVLVVIVSVLFGITTLRVRGPYFMLIGFAFAEAVRIAFSKSEFIGGTSGMTGIFPPRFMDTWIQSFVVGTVAVTIFALYVVEKTDFGKVLVAIRDNENIARSVGINVLFCKVACFAIASFCAGIAGSLHAFVNNVISPGDFTFLLASMALAYVKVGGESSIFGAVAGAIILVLLGSFALGLGAGEQLFYGAAIVLAVLLMPKGLTGLLDKFVRKVPRVKLAEDSSLEQKSASKLSRNGG